MGNWSIHIQGVGCHHNGDSLPDPKDARKAAGRFVKELKDAGHHVESATFTYGAKDNLAEAKPLPGCSDQ